MSNLDRYCSNVKVISVDGRDDRKAGITAGLSRLGIPFTFLKAAVSPGNPRTGCATSHLRALADFQYNSTAEYLLLLEDDCVFHPDFTQKFNELDLKGQDWDTLRLGCLHMEKPCPVDGITHTRRPLDAHAIIYKRSAIAKYVALLQYSMAIDIIWDKVVCDLGHQLQIYACHPNLVWQSVTVSDIAMRKYSNYTKDGKQIYMSHVLD